MLNMNKTAFVTPPAARRPPPPPIAPVSATIFACGVYKIYPNPRMSAELHEMHALLQQLQDLNELHDLDHCESEWMDKLYAGAARAGNGLVAGVKGGVAMAGGAAAAYKKHYKDAAAQKARDTAVLTAWGAITPEAKKNILQDVVKSADPEVIGHVLLGNETTKYMTQEGILPSPKE